MKLVILKSFNSYGKDLKAGEVYEITYKSESIIYCKDHTQFTGPVDNWIKNGYFKIIS